MALTDSGRVLGLDYGMRRIGVALSDSARIVATPIETIEVQSDKEGLRRVRELVAEHKVGVVVLGHPIHMDGGRGELALAAEGFAARLRAQVPGLVVELKDERLSSQEAERAMRAGDLHAKRRKEMRDQLAAQLILQSWLDAQTPMPPPDEEDDGWFDEED